MTATEVAVLISPELILLLGIATVLVLDLVLGAGHRAVLPYVALAAVVLAALAAALVWNRDEVLFSGMLAVDSFAVYFKLIALGATALVILGAKTTIEKRADRQGEFYLLLLFACLASMLATAAADLLSLYLAFEFLSLSSYVLVSYLRGSGVANEAGVKYFLYGAVTSAVMLYGVSLLYGATGTTNLSGIAAALAGPAASLRWLAIPTTVLLLAGFGFKTAIAPFHQWVPDVYEGAPTPVTAFLSVASKATGMAVLMRVMVIALGDFQPTWARILGAFAIVSMLLGNLVALQQSNIKRMLAYSSIAHAGYLTIGFVTYALVPRAFNGLNGVLFYLATYLFTNIGVFLAVIAVEEATGSTTISDYAGLWKRSPVVAVLMAYLLLSLTGMPVTGGMFAKLTVFGSAMQAGPFGYLLAGVGVITSVVAAFYYLNVVRYMFFVPPADTQRQTFSRGVSVALAICAAATLVIGFFPQPFVDFASRSVLVLGAVL